MCTTIYTGIGVEVEYGFATLWKPLYSPEKKVMSIQIYRENDGALWGSISYKKNRRYFAAQFATLTRQLVEGEFDSKLLT